MVEKAGIVAALAGSSLLLPDIVVSALRANSRIKFALSWLQAAEAPEAGNNSRADALEPERRLAGLGGDAAFAPPSGVIRLAEGVKVPGAKSIVTRMLEDLSEMIAAVEAGVNSGLADAALLQKFRQREAEISRAILLQDDVLPPGFVPLLSRPPREGSDSLHGLVMDGHKALNAILAGLSEEDVAGARVYRLEDRDKAHVAAFMRGLNRTAPLKFDHPGLATTATRDGARLILQNDIGTTDAHVLLAYVENNSLSVVYSDIHLRRLEFFQHRLKDLSWTLSSRNSSTFEEETFYVATGVLNAANAESLNAGLERLGASLVFLIDWNKARKSLRRLAGKATTSAILEWAAEREIGHRGYLEIGGDVFIADLLQTVSKATGGFYTTLQGAVGEEGVRDFLQEVLRIASEGLRSGQSAATVRDTMRAELLARVASIGDRILDIALDHAALTLDLANLVRATLLDGPGKTGPAAARAGGWEALADEQVKRIRDLCGEGKERAWRVIASAADDAADNFEEAVYRLQFLAGNAPAEVREGLLRLAEHAVTAVKEYVRLLSALRRVHRGADRQDVRDFFRLVERLHDQEHATDQAEREIFATLMHLELDAKELNVATTVARELEQVGDALLRTGHLVADHAMGEWFAA